MPRAKELPAPSLFPELGAELDEVPAPERAPARRARAREQRTAPAETWELFARVALPVPMRCEYGYGVPAALAGAIEPGARVVVPLGPQRMIGVVVACGADAGVEIERVRPIERLLDPEPLVGRELLELSRWVAETYACSWGEALSAILPAPLKRERRGRATLCASATSAATAEALAGLETSAPKQHRALRTLLELSGPIELRELSRKLGLSDCPIRSLEKAGLAKIERRERERDPFATADLSGRQRPAALSEGQARALAAIEAALEARAPQSFLLQGVTGSGKTEVYLRAIEAALARGRGAIVLVPEIALTPQTVSWFRSRFERVAVLHSRLTDGERLAMWLALQRRQARVVVGARSAVFAPVPDLGVIVVDEEHEPSFKQGNDPRYHARDVALERARAAGAVCILGSATPSLESWERARAGRSERLLLPERVSGARMPGVRIVDLRTEKTDARTQGLFSEPLCEALESAFRRREQSILFLNRRGFAPILWCPGCREPVRCAQCDVSLAWHKRIRRLVCHLCCEELAFPSSCPSCTHPGLRMIGSGSERVEAAVAALLPGARLRRMDSDTMLRRDDYESALDAFGRGEIDVLVGTQMIAKGLDFPRVTVVGIVSADVGLHLPDFRAAERTFQLVSQVAGRAGRGELAGRTFVQTLVPEHPAIARAAAHDFEGFAAAESELRAELGYPPHGRAIRAVLEDADESRVERAAEEAGAALRRAVEGSGAEVLGPAPAPMSRVRGRYRMHLFVKCPPAGAGFERARAALLEIAATATRPRLAIDVDPVSML